MTAAAERSAVETGWKFKRTDQSDDSWAPVATVPTVVHMDLLDNKKIPDPFIDTNELDVEWIGEHSWTYQTTFTVPDVPNGASVYLLFDGLDTFAHVRLNNISILESENMFLSHRVAITDNLHPSGFNHLVIDFDSALLRGRELEKKHPEHRFIAHNGETGRLGVRKAQYHWGWDWGPVLMTAGPFRPIRLEVSFAYIDFAKVDYELSYGLSTVIGKVSVDIAGSAEEVVLSLQYKGKEVYSTTTPVAADGSTILNFQLDDAKLWYPSGYGEQPLYDVVVHAVKGGKTLDTWEKKTGFRRSELVQKKDRHGESFYIRVNNIDIFCGGSCWIPADNFLPRITPDKYRSWLELMIEGNQIMTRVWGGGIYEEDAFYDTCDELGILVWQDFMFACGSYPAWTGLRDSVREEAKQNIRRLRHHPSVILWAGNNEDYQIQEEYKLDYDYENKDAESWLKGSFPARYYYEYLLPAIMKEEAPAVAYWPSSPFSGGKNSFDLTIGDVHQWNVWHGTQEKYQKYDQIGGRFNSEFGLASFPVIDTVHSMVSKTQDLHPQSRVLDFHNKADGHERRIATYIAENFQILPNHFSGSGDSPLQLWVYLTQLSQSEAVAYAYRGWRREWGDERRCGGALVWQLNDCWPASSWAIVDYYLRRKPAFYIIKRALQPIVIGVQRVHHDWSVCHARPAKSSAYSVWVASSSPRESKVDIELRFISIESGKDIRPAVIKSNVTVTANGTTTVISGEINNLTEELHVLATRILENGVTISRDVDWPQPFKYLSLENRGVKVDVHPGRYVVSAERPTKGLVFEEVDGVVLSDNCLDVIPGDPQVVEIGGSSTAQPKSRYLGFEH
ncbi:glycoside hydrolase superfamily [Aspergillus cavernicola]|uniref:Beta-mannosidase B n=1 Tax=Aspergillus cavernicola TaxID=176166 RepID=A0ABR4IVJ8_9EURO